MKTPTAILSLLITVCAMMANAESPPAPRSPAEVDPLDVIDARENLMLTIEQLMVPIDTYTVDDTVDPAKMRDNATAIAAMLQAVPHLFPANSNLYDPDAASPVTLALPAIWRNFANFYQLAATAASAATRLAESGDDPDQLRADSLGLRATCDACHGAYLLPYEEPSVSEEDLNFDFDALFDEDQ